MRSQSRRSRGGRVISQAWTEARQTFAADRSRYRRNSWWTERQLWAVAVYRFGQAVKLTDGPLRPVLYGAYGALALIVQVLTGVDIPASAQIGAGLRIHHAGPVIVNANVKIGKNCTLRTGVVIGSLDDSQGSPTLGDNVELGVDAKILGPVSVGDDAKIGAMALVLRDVPAGATAVGVPARIIARRD